MIFSKTLSHSLFFVILPVRILNSTRSCIYFSVKCLIPLSIFIIILNSIWFSYIYHYENLTLIQVSLRNRINEVHCLSYTVHHATLKSLHYKSLVVQVVNLHYITSTTLEFEKIYE